jgi:hypothetical protein
MKIILDLAYGKPCLVKADFKKLRVKILKEFTCEVTLKRLVCFYNTYIRTSKTHI